MPDSVTTVTTVHFYLTTLYLTEILQYSLQIYRVFYYSPLVGLDTKMDKNIFDEDDALDYVLYEESESELKGLEKSGCLSVFILVVLPVIGVLKWL